MRVTLAILPSPPRVASRIVGGGVKDRPDLLQIRRVVGKQCDVNSLKLGLQELALEQGLKDLLAGSTSSRCKVRVNFAYIRLIAREQIECV